jgi:hypothetical protein
VLEGFEAVAARFGAVVERFEAVVARAEAAVARVLALLGEVVFAVGIWRGFSSCWGTFVLVDAELSTEHLFLTRSGQIVTQQPQGEVKIL